ncbi:MAG: lipid IV(A) 3-deoxy-D-manno-octulosonic acid transferase [Colwellia sp.]|nr:lipid IV(A) 3-deoxy-D-manno-octulosonic acid transferase [Colwellia sp.]
MRYQFSLMLYRLISLCLLPIIGLLLLFRSIKQKAYRQRLSERFGFLPRALKPGGIIVHAASVGEVIALKSFITQLLAAKPNAVITVTTFTPTGSAQVKKLFDGRVQHCYLPLDSTLCVAAFLNKLKPQAMVFMETELWPNLIAQSKVQGIKLLLINGRLSKKSMKSYRKLAWLITPTINCFDKVLCQSQINYQHFLALDADTVRCEVSGNVKFDISISQSVKDKQAELTRFIDQKRPVWVVASTHQGDETIALNAFSVLLKLWPELLLILVPRHPERFNDVASLCTEQGFTVVRRSQKELVSNDTQIWLLDSLGELLPTCALASVVTMGGSFSDIGGHNPLEPALFKKPIVVGSNMSNFVEVMQQLLEQQGIVQLTQNHDENNEKVAEHLAKAINDILSSKDTQQALGDNAYHVVMQNQGASKRSLKQLLKLI